MKGVRFFQTYKFCRSSEDVKPLLSSYRHRKRALLRDKKGESDSSEFVDLKALKVRGGKGGDGAVTFLSEYCRPFGGPDGGNGGNGGHIIFQATTNKNSLNHLSSVYIGNSGDDGHSKNCHGKNAHHTVIPVPIGSIFKNVKGEVLADLEKPKLTFVGARGGAGGRGNHSFMCNENKAPAFAEFGSEGEEVVLSLEIRTIAHAGLVGFPNAGKSTLLRAISRAIPKVSAFPFTTLKPHIGVIQYSDHQQLSVADLPGLIPDAHKNFGLGSDFLRHIQRCVCIWYIIDISVEKPWEQLQHLQYELEQYKKGFSNRRAVVVANKMDVDFAGKKFEELKKRVDHLPLFPISAKRKTGILQLLSYFYKACSVKS